jgi:restriction system protein
MRPNEKYLNLSSRDYELAVKGILDGAGFELTEFSSKHLEPVPGVDGSYAIDVTVRFTALGAQFLVLVECKHERRKVERSDVQILHDKVRSTGAQKGMLFSTAGFQDGAIQYAGVHGLALVQLAGEESTWFTKSFAPVERALVPEGVRKYVGLWCHGTRMSVMSPEMGEYTRSALGVSGASLAIQENDPIS